MKAPSSPQVLSGAQSSNPKGSLDLQQQESDLTSQMDKPFERAGDIRLAAQSYYCAEVSRQVYSHSDCRP